MLTKYYIEIDGEKSEVPKRCLSNWDEIQCVYKRSDFSGVTRSFTTQFEFVGEIYDRLMALYMRDGVNARAAISLYTITNEWAWEEQFTCDLDFSSIKWDNYIVKVNCIDNSLAALIKSKKSAKYEAVVDTDIKSDRIFAFNRLPVKNSITYAYTGGNTDDKDGSIAIDQPYNNRVYMGVVSEEDAAIKNVITWNEDQTTDTGSFMLRAYGEATVQLEVDIDSDRCFPNTPAPDRGGESADGLKYDHTNFNVCITHANGSKDYENGISFGPDNLRFCGRYSSLEALQDDFPHDRIVVNGGVKANYWALINGIVWAVVYHGSAERTNWHNTGLTQAEFGRRHDATTITLELTAGDKVSIETYGSRAKLYSSKFSFSWIAKDKPISVSAFSPAQIGQFILNKMCLGHTNTQIEISDFDYRIKNTVVIAAESIRGIPSAKVYTSFNEFCDWMETVFGYTYCLGSRTNGKFVAHKKALGGEIGTPYPLTDEPWEANHKEAPDDEEIIYFSCYSKFCAFDGFKWYRDFPGVYDYNDINTGLARTDSIFTIRRTIGNEITDNHYYFTENGDGSSISDPLEYYGNIEDFDKPYQAVRFIHRAELFNPCASVIHLSNIRDLEYSVDNGQIYSTINIGYDKKDYQNINGRDEFNFNNTYSTGCLVSDKKLTIKSKYRADCYGIEFAAQKRGEDTTDTTSDNDVFFAYCRVTENGLYAPDTSLAIENALSDQVFNGVFSPMACIEANEGFIGMQINPLQIEFTSSEGNSDIVIGGLPMKASWPLTHPLMTCGTVQFSSPAIDAHPDVNAIYEVQSDGVTYRGFLKEVSFKYAKAETVKYNLIVKEIEL